MELLTILLPLSPAEGARVAGALPRPDFAVDEAASREEALGRLQRGGDLVIVVEGGESAALLEFCRMVRAVSMVPLVVVAQRADDRSAAVLGAGADLVLAEPFSDQFLREAITALMRRSRPEPGFASTFEIRGLTIDFERHEARFQGQVLSLTPFELRVLSCLAVHAGRVVSAQRLLQYVQDSEEVGQDATETVKVHVHHLRRKLQLAGGDGFIKTARGFGYILDRRAATRPGDPLATLFPLEEGAAPPNAADK